MAGREIFSTQMGEGFSCFSRKTMKSSGRRKENEAAFERSFIKRDGRKNSPASGRGTHSSMRGGKKRSPILIKSRRRVIFSAGESCPGEGARNKVDVEIDRGSAR